MSENNPKLLVDEDKEKYNFLLESKKTSLKKLFDETYQYLNDLAVQKDEINKKVEAVQTELSGLNGALTVLDELIEETKIQSGMEM